MYILLAVAATAAAAGAAQAAGAGGGRSALAVGAPTPTLGVSLEPGRRGFLTVVVRGPVGVTVAVRELGTATAPSVAVGKVTLREPSVRLRNAVPWRCSDLAPTVEATEASVYGVAAPARASTTTPSCAHRLAVATVSMRAHTGYPVTVEITDTWAQGGLRVRGCVGGSCETRTLGAGRPTFMRLRPRFAGTVRVVVSDPYEQVDQRLHVGGGRPLLLATGDSEMQLLDDFMASDLAHPGGARVINDARQSTAITSPFFFNWPAHAAGQVAASHPDIVAMFLGGNEGFPIGGTACCGVAWSRRYAGLVERMMATYRQRGAAAVYWFLIPTPSTQTFVSLVNAVNRGIVLAAARFPHDVHAFDLRPTFSPGGRYIDSLDYQGHNITVHESDGFHLSVSADVIVAHLLVARLRLDGVLP